MINTPLHDNLKTLLEGLQKAAPHICWPGEGLVAASKTRSADEIRAAFTLGIRHFGENYVQEAARKHAEGAYAGAKLHLIGHLQGNKARKAVELFDVIETVDSTRLADTLNRLARELGRAPLAVLVQVNIGSEPQKDGVAVEGLDALVRHIRTQCPALVLQGLMATPPAGADPTPYFTALAVHARRLGLGTLSMGMSGDWPQALACGATHIRLGTALFGAR